MNKYVSAAVLRAPLLAGLLACAVSQSAFAQTVPSPWTAQDIGAPTLSGSATYNSGVFTVDAAGTDIWGSSDQLHFVYQAVSGDVEIIARVNSLDDVYEWTNAGVMIRSSLSANAAIGYTASTSAHGVYFRRRLSSGALMSSVSGGSTDAPVWVRLVRTGNVLTSYVSTTGTSWTTIGSSTVSLSTTAYVGLAVTSHNTSTRATAVFSSVTVNKSGGGGGTTTLPNGQKNQDIGSPSIAGSTTYSSGTYTIKAAGTDIWDVADQFHFVYQPVTGNVDVVARVASIVNTYSWAKAGVMVRESLSADARHASMFISAASGNAFQRRREPATYSVNTSGGSGTAPGWVRLVRTGDLFEAYRSADGAAWTRISSDTVAMGDTVYVGLAVTSHNVSALTTAVVDNVKITASTPQTNQSPAVSIASPSNGTSITPGTAVVISATASDPENRMASVDLYAGSTMLKHDTTSPYSVSWSPTTAGTYALTAIAHDQDGGSSVSSAVNVTVGSSTNTPPTVTLSTGGVSFTAPATINFAATATDSNGTIARVEFFNGSTRLATDTTAPYSYAWTNVAVGTYQLKAVAYDNAGASGTSATITVTVASTPVTPPKTVVFQKSTDHSTNVTNYVLKIFAAGANPSTATPVATSDLGKPTPASNGDITVDRTTFFQNLAVGSYLATVTAVGPGGQTPSASVSFTR